MHAIKIEKVSKRFKSKNEGVVEALWGVNIKTEDVKYAIPDINRPL